MKHPLLFVAAILGLAACDPGTETRKDAVPEAQAPTPALPASQATPQTAPLVAAGPAVTVQPSDDLNIQYAASVVKLDQLTKQGGPTVKLFAAAGGDPAMNGLYTDIAFFRSSAEGWAVFRVGDFLDYAVLSEAPGRVDLKVEESVMDEATGQIGRRERRLIIAWTPGANEAPPAAITVTPAQ
ncbi:hypothetical protein [Brevundimonas sp.]|uniref:hypothetical protein n=1 Tax=Brevundimonas sp. TaxID=1871086 RepID=UPI003F70D382